MIVGIGLNVNTEAADFPVDFRNYVTSLLLSSGRPRDLDDAARDLLKNIELLYERVKREGCSYIPELWATRWAHRGAQLIRRALPCTAEGIDTDGALLIRAHDGELLRVTSEESELTWPDLRKLHKDSGPASTAP
jgi:BirA family biotin operon repressor/biotin-[acetyl-CoA-carboxylase] ligase